MSTKDDPLMQRGKDAMGHIESALAADRSGELRRCGLHIAACFAINAYGMRDPGRLLAGEEYCIGVLGLQPRLAPSSGWEVVRNAPENVRLATYQLMHAIDLVSELERTVMSARHLLRVPPAVLTRMLDRLEATVAECKLALTAEDTALQ